MGVDAARLRLVDFGASIPATHGPSRRQARTARTPPTRIDVTGPSGLHWRVRLLCVPSAMRPHPPREMLALADPATGWTPLAVGWLLVPLALPFLPLVLLLRRLRLLPWTVEARAYPWGRRYPPIVLTYETRGREEAVAAVAALAAGLARGDGAPMLPGCARVG